MIVSGKGVDLDDVLINFRLSGRYHLLNIFLTFIAGLSNAFYSYNYIFVAEEVSYSCKYANATNNETCSRMAGEYSCREWKYDEPNSFVAEFNLACQEWKRTLVGSAHSFGYMIGLLVVGPLSDRIGRKATIVLTGVMGGVIGLARSFVTWYWLYVALEFLEAVIGDIYSPAYMMAVEVVATQKRILFITFTNFGFPIGCMIAALVGWGFPYWRTYLRVLYTPGLLFVVYWYLLQESPRWLLSNGKTTEAIAVLKKACEMNKMKIDDKTLEKLTYEDEGKTVNLIELLKITFSSPTILKRFLICVVWWVTSTFVNYGMTINSVTLQGNKYVNYAILGLLDIPGFLMTMYIMNRLKRKFSLIMCFFMGAAFCLVQPFVPTNLPWLSVTLFMAGKVISGFYFEITYMYTSELFPTYTRNSMHALCSSLGRIGSIIAPQTPLLMAYWSGLPAIVYGSMALLAGVLTIFVPDTANNALPDTVAQAEALGRKVTGTEKDLAIKELDNPKNNATDNVQKISESSRVKHYYHTIREEVYYLCI